MNDRISSSSSARKRSSRRSSDQAEILQYLDDFCQNLDEGESCFHTGSDEFALSSGSDGVEPEGKQGFYQSAFLMLRAQVLESGGEQQSRKTALANYRLACESNKFNHAAVKRVIDAGYGNASADSREWEVDFVNSLNYDAHRTARGEEIDLGFLRVLYQEKASFPNSIL